MAPNKCSRHKLLQCCRGISKKVSTVSKNICHTKVVKRVKVKLKHMNVH